MITFQPLPIGIDESAEQRFTSNVRIKRRYINELYDYANKFIEIKDKSTLQENFYDTFINSFLDKYKDKFPPISVYKMLEQLEVDIKKIDALCQEVEAIPIQLDKKLDAKKPDFNIYTETEEQNKLYITLKRLCKDINALKEYGIRLQGNNLIHGTQQMLAYDWSKQEMVPNTRRILGKDLRG